MKKILILLATLAIIAPLSAFAEDCQYDTYKPFTDVDHFLSSYEKAVEFLAQEGIVSGYADGTFKPTNEINRAEMLKILAEGSAIYKGLSNDIFDEYSNDNCFQDVPANEWYTKYVCYAKSLNWVEGYENGKYFKPTQSIIFVEGMKMALESFGIEYNKSTDPWYRGLVNTAGENLYIPCIWYFDQNLRREEMADIIARIIKKDRGELGSFLIAEDRVDDRPTYETIEKNDNVCFVIDLTEHEYCKPDPYVVEIKSTGFYPQNLEIPYYSTVIFVNEDTSPHWPFSSQVNLDTCGQNNYFPFGDCEQLAQNESYSYYMDYSGEYEYYDKLHPDLTGKITVTGDNYAPWDTSHQQGPTEESGYIW